MLIIPNLLLAVHREQASKYIRQCVVNPILSTWVKDAASTPENKWCSTSPLVLPLNFQCPIVLPTNSIKIYIFHLWSGFEILTSMNYLCFQWTLWFEMQHLIREGGDRIRSLIWYFRTYIPKQIDDPTHALINYIQRNTCRMSSRKPTIYRPELCRTTKWAETFFQLSWAFLTNNFFLLA